MSNTLLPCPFCGGEQAIKARYIGYGSLGLGSHDEYRVVCKECRASSDEYKSEAKAIAAWNRRAQPENKPLTCEGCESQGKYENEVEYGYPSPCTHCARRAVDNHRYKPEEV